MEPVRVVIVGDDPLARAGLAAVLGARPSVLVVAQAGPGQELAGTVEALGPDVVLWDLGRDPPDAEPQGFSPAPPSGIPVVALVGDDATAAQAIASGMQAVLPRDAGAGALSAAIAAAAEGLIVFDRAFAPADRATRDRDASTPVEELTPRELEVLQLLAEGLPNKTIARRLGISEHTVKFHLNAVLGKLDAHSRTEAVTRAARLGLIIL